MSPSISWGGSSFSIGADGTIYDYKGSELLAKNQDGSVKWSYTSDVVTDQSPVIGADGTIYIESGDGLSAINPDGSLEWTYLDGNIGSFFSVGADGTIYVDSGMYLYAIDHSGSLKWNYPLKWWVSCSPSIGADGTVYVGDMDGELYAIGE